MPQVAAFEDGWWHRFLSYMAPELAAELSRQHTDTDGAAGADVKGLRLCPCGRLAAVLQMRPEAVALGSGNEGGVKGAIPIEAGVESGEMAGQQLLHGKPFGTVVLVDILVLPICPMHLVPHAFELGPEEGE